MILDKIHYVLLGSRTNSMKCGMMMTQHLFDHMDKPRISKMLEIHFNKTVPWNGRSHFTKCWSKL